MAASSRITNRPPSPAVSTPAMAPADSVVVTSRADWRTAASTDSSGGADEVIGSDRPRHAIDAA
ncbi:MAG: hypothetical protein ABMA25_15560 [Ilumatobacteraceae bacterium]